MEEKEEQEVVEEVDDLDGDGNIGDEELGEVEDDTTVEEQEETKPEPKKKQSREEDSKYAKLRREKKELETEIERLKAEKKEADFRSKADKYDKTILEDLGIDQIKTEKELFLAEKFKEAEERGDANPSAYAYKAYVDKLSDDAQKTEEQERIKADNRKKSEEDRKVFIEKYGQDALDRIVEHNSYKDDNALAEKFLKYFGRFLEHGNLTELYGTFLEGEGIDADSGKSKGVIPTVVSKPPKSTQHEETDEEFLARWNRTYGS